MPCICALIVDLMWCQCILLKSILQYFLSGNDSCQLRIKGLYHETNEQVCRNKKSVVSNLGFTYITLNTEKFIFIPSTSSWATFQEKKSQTNIGKEKCWTHNCTFKKYHICHVTWYTSVILETYSDGPLKGRNLPRINVSVIC